MSVCQFHLHIHVNVLKKRIVGKIILHRLVCMQFRLVRLYYVNNKRNIHQYGENRLLNIDVPKNIRES